MTNVIRPTFGSKPQAKPAEKGGPVPHPGVHLLLRVYGKAAGYFVALISDETDPAGHVVKVVVGTDTSDEVDAVAMMPATPEGEAEAAVAAMAILRTLEVIEEDRRP